MKNVFLLRRMLMSQTWSMMRVYPSGTLPITLVANISGMPDKESVSYGLSDDGTHYIVTRIGTATKTDINIAPSVDGIPVKKVGYGAFGNTKITSIILPDDIVEIGQYAFNLCANLEDINFPINLTSIGDMAFRGCKALTNVVLPDKVEAINAYTFADCTSLKSFTLGKSFNSFLHSALTGCTALEEILVHAENEYYFSHDGVLYNEAGTLVLYPVGKTATSYIVWNGTETIGTDAFSGASKLTNIVFQNSNLRVINSRAFKNCTALKSVVLPPMLNTIGTEAFYGCTSLGTVDLSRFSSSFPVVKTGAFNGHASAFQILVRAGRKSALLATSGWSQYASYVVEV